MKAEIKIEEIINKVNETKSSVEGAQDLVNRIISLRDKLKSNDITKSEGSYEIAIKKTDTLLTRYTTNNNIDKITDGFTGKEKINSAKFDKLKKEFLNILNELKVQFTRVQK
jgi:hypothetical protein